MRFLVNDGKVMNSQIKYAFKTALKLNVVKDQDINLGLRQLLEIYDIEEIQDAISKFQYDGISFVIQDGTSFSKIIRYLEYGGENVRPPKLITKTLNDISLRRNQWVRKKK